MRFEMTVYGLADRFSADYSGGFWQFYTLQPDGFYMAPMLTHRSKSSMR